MENQLRTEEQARQLFRISFIMPKKEALAIAQKGEFSAELTQQEAEGIFESLKAGLIGVELEQNTTNESEVEKAIAKVKIDQIVSKLLDIRSKIE